MHQKSTSRNSFRKLVSQLLVICMMFLVIGCGSAGQPAAVTTQEVVATSPPPSATLPPPPTDTPMPTETPVPTDTPTPLPTNTATPDFAATQAFEATRVADQLIADIKAQLAEYKLPSDVGHLGWVQTEPEIISMQTYGDYFYSPFAEDLTASDFVLSTDITWETEGLVMCGLMFRSEPNFETGAMYSFLYLRISGLPAWAIEYIKDGQFVSTISDIKFSKAINLENGATNKLILAAEGNKFTLIVNNERVGSFYDWSSLRMDGKFAFQGQQETGPSTCTFNNTWIWMLK